MKFEVITITPDMARLYLQKNTNNRRLNMAYVDHLANEITDGRWKINGDSIRMNGDKLLDGQHRLHAVIKSNVAITTAVISELDSSVFDTIDCGKKRTASDVLSINGEKETMLLAASLVVLHNYLSNSFTFRSRLSTTLIEQLLDEHPLIRESVRFYSANNTHGFLPSSVAVALHYLCAQKDINLSNTFWQSVSKGTSLPSSNASIILREKLIKQALSKQLMAKSDQAALCIKAWNHTRQNKNISVIRWTDKGPAQELFPLVQ